MDCRHAAMKQTLYTLLEADEPDPVELLHPTGASPFFLTCEHAGRRIPRRLGDLGLSEPDLSRHIAWDIGAAAVARQMSEKLQATLVLQTYSRLVVDCNRWPTAHDFVCSYSENTTIPGNVAIGNQAAKAREEEIFWPYHDRVRVILDERVATGRETVLVSIHSCTPVYLGVSRPWHIGVLYERDRRFAVILMDELATHEDICVGDNEPYFMTDEKDYAVPVHGERRGLPHVELEIRQDLIDEPAGQQAWAKRLTEVFTIALERFRRDYPTVPTAARRS